MAAPKWKFAYEVKTTTEHVYKHTHITVFARSDAPIMESIDSLIEGCIDNKAGYASDEVAAQCKERYEAFKRQRVTAILAMGTEWLQYTWQHYGQDQYCQVNIKLPSQPGELAASYRVHQYLMRRMFKAAHDYRARASHDPAHLLRVLANRKAVELTRIANVCGPGSELCSVKPGKERPPEHTLTA